MRPGDYTKEEEAYLRENYPSGSSERIARHLGRTRTMIAKQARRLDVHKETKYPPRQLSEWGRGYLAGIIDGEGCIDLKRGRERKNGGYPYYPHLRIGNTKKAILDKVLEIVGCGSVRPISRTRVGKPFWGYQVGSEAISWLLPQLLLIGKEEIQVLILESLPIAKNGRAPEVQAKLEKIYTRIREINRRSIKKEKEEVRS